MATGKTLEGVEQNFLDAQLFRKWSRGGDGKAGGGHFSKFDKSAEANEVPLTPIAAGAARGEVLDGLTVINTLNSAVYPSET